jgi:hypothetical protein
MVSGVVVLVTVLTWLAENVVACGPRRYSPTDPLDTLEPSTEVTVGLK